MSGIGLSIGIPLNAGLVSGVQQIITAAVAPATSVLVSGQALDETTNWATLLLTSNYATSAGGATISTVVVNYIGDTATAIETLLGGETNHFSITVTDSLANQRTFTTSALTVAATVPDAPAAGDWSVADALTGNTIDITIISDPPDNGDEIDDYEYDVNSSGVWISGGNTIGFPATIPSNGVATDLRIRAVNSVGAGAASAVKSATATDQTDPVVTGYSFDSISTITATLDKVADYDWSITAASVTDPAVIKSGVGAIDSGGPVSLVAGSNSTPITYTGTDGVAFLNIVFTDPSGNETVLSNQYTFPDTIAPTFLSGSPADDATGVAVGAAIVLTFDETVAAPTAGGEFYLYTGVTLVETFDVDAGTGDNSGTIAVSGANVTITPGANLLNSTAYNVEWNAAAVEDSAGNPVAANTADTLYNFTTAAAAGGNASVADGLATFVAADGAQVPVDVDISALDVQTDDVVFVVIALDSSPGGNPVTEAGYTESLNENTGNSPGWSSSTKVMGATVDTAIEITPSTVNDIAVLVTVLRDVDTAAIFDVTPNQGSDVAIASATPPAITSVTANALSVILHLLDDDNAAGTGSAPSGYTDFLQAEAGTPGLINGGATIARAAQSIATASTVTPGAWVGMSSDSERSVHFMFKNA